MQMLDFNALQQPSWPVKLKDDEQTVVHVSAPTVELYDRLIAATPELENVSKTKDGRTIRALYNLVADIMSINDDGYKFTGEELRDKYRLTLVDIIRFVGGYLKFQKEIQDAKN
jgi:hypothetical protein